MTVSSTILSHSWIPGAAMLAESLAGLFAIEANDLVVTDPTGAVQVLGTDYTVTGNLRTGAASIRTLRVYPAGVLLTVTRVTDRVQTVALSAGQPLPSKTLELELDRRTLIEQEQDATESALAARTVRAAVGEPGLVLPPAANLIGTPAVVGIDPGDGKVKLLNAYVLKGDKGNPGANATQGVAAWLGANKRGEPYAAGWLGKTSRETYSYTSSTAEGTAPEYFTTLRNTAYPVTIDGTPYPRYAFSYLVPHGLIVGDRVEVSGCAVAGYNGTRPVYAVVDDLTIQIDYGGAVLGAPGGTPKATAYGRVFNAADPLLRYSFPREGMRFASAVPDFSRNANPVLPPPRSYVLNVGQYTCDFVLHDDQLEVFTRSGGQLDVWVDGCLLSLTGFPMAITGYPFTLHKFVFGRGRKSRQVRLAVDNSYLVGVAARTPGGISGLPPLRRLRVALLGDSFGEPTGAATAKLGFPQLLAARFGWDLVNLSAGGTGINTDGGGAFGKKKFVDRADELVLADPDVVLVMNSINVVGPLLAAQCTGLFDAIVQVTPKARVLGLGRVYYNTAPGAQNLADDLVFKAACEAYAIPFIDGGIGTNGSTPWLTAGNNSTYYNGTAATGTTALTGAAVTGTVVTLAGDGYDFFNTPVVTLAGGGGAGAVLTPVWNAEVTAVQVLNGGFGYLVAPTVVIENGATAVSNRSGGTDVTGLAVTNPGGGYTTPPAVTITGGGGAGATAVAVIEDGKVVRLDVTAPGVGYAADPVVTIAESTTKATATATIAGGKVTGLTITGAGSFYTSIPRIRFVPDASGGQGAVAVAHVAKKLSALTITAGGAGYATPPIVTIAHPTNGDAVHPKSIGHMMLAERFGMGIERIGL